MPKVKSNDIILTQEEADALNAKLDLITTPQELIVIAKDMYNAAGIDLVLNWSPQLTSHRDWSGSLTPCFKGRISGSNTNHSGKQSPEVYSLSGITKSMSTFSNLLRIKTGTGGGGDKWSYDYGYIQIEDFPAMTELYSAEIAATYVDSEKAKFQNSYDAEIRACTYKLNDFESSAKYHRSTSDLDEAIKKAEKLVTKLKSDKTDNIADLVNEMARDFVVPTCTSPFIDLARYNQLTSRLKCRPFAQAQTATVLAEAQKAFDKVLETKPEFFI